MYFTIDEPRAAPFNADDLKQSDAESIKLFLDARIREVREEHAVGDREMRVVDALENSVGPLIEQLSKWFENDEAETLRGRMLAWNRVVLAVWPWEGTEGYDARRWRVVKHTDSENAVEDARRFLQWREEQAARKRAKRKVR